ncbi:hypothetical protein LEP1GSC175_1296 [Leptospira santarosai str. HAI821]|nr:hypothetical protein LEP1GSC163_2003 [Leptospira santarosai str. CBC379]EMO32601.1 hypothetical protein LEP1GSC175_1296 [Leptospira santarosai str. HAI821]EPG82993.1 hypothetical protein LEP1GSC048_3341 [Leptospira santarosai serovar Shermani str. 1342KT]
MGVPTWQESRSYHFILNSKPGNVGVPTNYVSLDTFCRFERTFYNEVP